ncbi:MAG TPA: glutathione S-transferase family protein [Steroidobacteraceae bacterium]|nr:glutathione S-transferase family protein [Steroidobacteraceae bacterium]
MKLYEFAPTRSIRARWILQELEADFEAVTVNLAAREHRRAEFLELNPAGKVPVLVDGDLVLTESVAIVLYLAEKYPDRGFLPTELDVRANLYRWVLFAVTELEQPLWRIARHTTLYPETDRLAADVVLARRDFLPMAAILEEHMKGRTYVVSDRVSAADFVLAYTLDWAGEVRLLGECPTLRNYVERMYDRPRAPQRIGEILRSLRDASTKTTAANA